MKTYEESVHRIQRVSELGKGYPFKAFQSKSRAKRPVQKIQVVFITAETIEEKVAERLQQLADIQDEQLEGWFPESKPPPCEENVIVLTYQGKMLTGWWSPEPKSKFNAAGRKWDFHKPHTVAFNDWVSYWRHFPKKPKTYENTKRSV